MLATGNNPLDSYRLSIRISTDGFSLYIHSTADGKLLKSEHIPFGKDGTTGIMLEGSLRKMEMLGYNFSQVTLAADTPSTYVPLEYFRKEEMAHIYNLTFPNMKTAGKDVQYRIMPSLEVVELFSIDTRISDIVQGHYPNVQTTSFRGEMLEQAASLSKRLSTPCMHAVLAEGKMLLCSFTRGKLQFAATYDTTSDADCTYFIMAVWKSLNLDLSRDRLYLKGASEELRTNLNRFIKNVSICE